MDLLENEELFNRNAEDLFMVYQSLKDCISKRKKEKKNCLSILKKKTLPMLSCSQFEECISLALEYDLNDREDKLNELINKIEKDLIYDISSKLDPCDYIPKKSKYRIDCEEMNSKDLLGILCRYRLPAFKLILIDTYQSTCEYLNSFFLNSFSENQIAIEIHFHQSYSVDLNCNFIYLREAVSNFTEFISFEYLKVSSTQFCSLVKAARRVKVINFRSCTISIDDECYFAEMKSCKIECINFYRSNLTNSKNEEICKEGLFSILSGIANCENLRSSLNKINPYFAGFENDMNKIEHEIRSKFPTLNHIELVFLY